MVSDLGFTSLKKGDYIDLKKGLIYVFTNNNKILNKEIDMEQTTGKNTYAKYCPNVFVAKCYKKYEKGDTIEIETKYGKTHECIIFNEVLDKNGVFYYSVVRADGFNHQEFCKKRAERRRLWAESANKKSTEYYEKSRKDSAFLSMGEPIKVGHHSEKRHRKIIEQAQNNSSKSVEFSNLANEHESKIGYWEEKSGDINLSMPESLEYFEQEFIKAEENHKKILSGEIPREHNYTLTYAKKHLNEVKKKLDIAKKLWG